MRFDFAHHHLHHVNRRDALKLGAGAAAAVAVSAGLAERAEAHARQEGTTVHPSGPYTDEMFDVDAVLAGGHWVSPYGPDDQRGTFNEVTPERTAYALRLLNRYKVKTYQLGEELFNGFPAYPSDPPRVHQMHLFVSGVQAGPGFVEAGGIQGIPDGVGPNMLMGFEERFEVNHTYQIATQLDGLNHVGIATTDEREGRFYNDTWAADIIAPNGTTALGNETMGPIVTRGIIIDVVGLKVAQGATEDFFEGPTGEPILRDDYRITIDDIEKSLYRQRITGGFRPGDVPILHTGWTHLAHTDPARYLAQQPGIYLAEARYFIDRRVAIVGSDTWGLEVLDPEVTDGNLFPVHQELLGRIGIRIGEGFVTDAAIADHCYQGVFIITPQNTPGATAGSTPPALLGQPGPAPRS